jgi:hypothetical protein
MMREFHVDDIEDVCNISTNIFLRPWDEFAQSPFIGTGSLMNWILTKNRLAMSSLLAISTEDTITIQEDLDEIEPLKKKTKSSNTRRKLRNSARSTDTMDVAASWEMEVDVEPFLEIDMEIDSD